MRGAGTGGTARGTGAHGRAPGLGARTLRPLRAGGRDADEARPAPRYLDSYFFKRHASKKRHMDASFSARFSRSDSAELHYAGGSPARPRPVTRPAPAGSGGAVGTHLGLWAVPQVQ